MRCRLVLALAVTLPTAALADDWIIGAIDPNETVVLSEDRMVDGDVLVVNQGTLRVLGGTLTVRGNVGVVQDGLLKVTGARLRFAQAYAYQSGFFVQDFARLDFTDAVVDGNGRSYSAGLAGNASGRFERVTVENGFCTWVFTDDSSQDLIDCKNGGEFLPYDRAHLDISGTTTVLYWMVLPDGSEIDTTLPPPGSVQNWSLGPETPWAKGINYSVSLSSDEDVMWGIMARSGSKSTLRDSTIRAVGTIFERDDDITIQGLANKAYLSDSTLDWGSVHHRFINSSVQTWNFYPWATTRLTLDGCIFGEVNADGQADVQILSSMCDGTGGYIGAFGNSQVVMAWSTNLSQTTTKGNAFLFVVGSALLGPAIDSVDQSLMFLLNAQYVGEPEAHGASAIFDAAVDPFEGVAGLEVPLRGSARLVRGPDCPITWKGYSLDYGAGYNPQEWSPIFGPLDDMVRDGQLGVWNTAGLTPGPYAVRVNIHTNLEDPVSISSVGALSPDPCPSDLTGDGELDLFDFLEFVNHFGGGSARADCDQSGALDLFDFLCFVTAFNAGC